MKRSLFALVLSAFIGVGVVVAGPQAQPADISGTWLLSVDLETGGHGDPTFVLKQDKENLTGTYDGPLGHFNVTGTLKNNKAVFGFEFTTDDGVTHKATYTGTLESASKMTGTLVFTDGPRGEWSATKK